MELQNNVVGWFEIPVKRMERAVKFYETIFKVKLERHSMEYPAGKTETAWFPYVNAPGSPGALVKNKKWSKVTGEGVIIYFTTPSGDLESDLQNIKKAGGKILTARHKVSDDIGYIGLFTDTEGNKIAIHSRK